MQGWLALGPPIVLHLSFGTKNKWTALLSIDYLFTERRKLFYSYLLKTVIKHKGKNTRGKNWLLCKGPHVFRLICIKICFHGKRVWHLLDSATHLSFWLQIAEIMSFLLMYRLFLYYLWFFQNIEKGWRKNIFNFRHFEKSRK